MGFSFGKNLRANVSLITATRDTPGAPRVAVINEKSARERLIDNGNAWGTGCGTFIDGAPLQQARSDGFKIVRTNPVPGRRRPAIIGCFSFNVDAFIRVVAVQRGVPGQAIAQNAGDSRQRLLKPFIKPCKLIYRVTG